MPRAAIDSWAGQRPCARRTAIGASALVRHVLKCGSSSLGDGVPPGTYVRRAHSSISYAWINHRLHRLRSSFGTGGASAAQTGDGIGPRVPDLSSLSSVATPTTPLPSPAAIKANEAAPSWPALQPPFTYYASAEDAQSNAAPCGLSPLWKLLLLSDGSVTRHLQLLSGSPVSVECLSMRNVGWSLEGLPPGTELIPGPRIQRQVLLRCQAEPSSDSLKAGKGASSSCSIGKNSSNGSTSGSNGGCSGPDLDPDVPLLPQPPLSLPLVYASSWWNADNVDEYLRDKSKPIWVSLSQGHVELYREVHALFCGEGSPSLEQLLGCTGPFWARHYVFWSNGRPLTLIYEVFSPRLQQYLGPVYG